MVRNNAFSGSYMRDVKRDAEFEKDFRKDAIAEQVERRQKRVASASISQEGS